MQQELSNTSKLFNILVLVIDWQGNRTDSGTSKEVWNAFFMVSHRLAIVKDRALNGSMETIADIDSQQTSVASSPRNSQINEPVSVQTSPVSSLSTVKVFEKLPLEILLQIISYLPQQTIANCSQLNRRCYKMIIPILYQNPYLTSPSTITRYLGNIEKSSSKAKFTQKVRFAPTVSGTLSNPRQPNPRFDLLTYVHSGLFNLLLQDKEHHANDDTVIHPIFYRLAKSLPKGCMMEELGLHKENRANLAQMDSNGKPDISRIPSSSLSLSILMRSCSRWFSEFPEWDGMKESIKNCYNTAILILDWFQGDFHPIWHKVGSTVVRSVKPLIQNKCRALLSHMNSTLLLQIRFITGNSQRLLDCYCLIYYRILSLAQGLDVQGLADAMNSSSTTTDQTPLLQNEETDRQDDSLIGPKECEDSQLTTHQRAARCIYEALMVIFHMRIPRELQTNRNVTPHLPVQMLRDIIITFPPSSINQETVEMVQRLILIELDENDDSYFVLNQWMSWLKEIVLWHEASLEMEPVKDMLRKSMRKIDLHRGLQRRYGISFME